LSDIGFQGLLAAMVGVGMLAIALIGLAVEGLLLWLRRRARRDARGFLLGPVLYAVVAGVVLYLVEEGGLAWKEFLDAWSWLVALVALGPWIGAHALRRA